MRIRIRCCHNGDVACENDFKMAAIMRNVTDDIFQSHSSLMCIVLLLPFDR